MTEEDIKNLSKKELQDIIFKVQKLLSDKQKKEFQKIVKEAGIQPGNKKSQAALVRMSDDFVGRIRLMKGSFTLIQKSMKTTPADTGKQTGLQSIMIIRESAIRSCL